MNGPERTVLARRSPSKADRPLVLHVKLPGGAGPSGGAPSAPPARLSSPYGDGTRDASRGGGCGVEKDVSLIASSVGLVPREARRHRSALPQRLSLRLRSPGTFELVRVSQQPAAFHPSVGDERRWRQQGSGYVGRGGRRRRWSGVRSNNGCTEPAGRRAHARSRPARSRSGAANGWPEARAALAERGNGARRPAVAYRGPVGGGRKLGAIRRLSHLRLAAVAPWPLSRCPERGPSIPARAAWCAVPGLLAGYALAIVGATIGDALSGSATGPVTTLLSEMGLWAGMLGTVIFVSRRYGSASLRRDFGLEIRGTDVLWGFAAVAAALIVSEIVVVVFAGTKFAGSNDQIISQQKGHEAGLVILTLIVELGAPFFEELFFRGFLRTALQERFGAGGAVWLQAAFLRFCTRRRIENRGW